MPATILFIRQILFETAKNVYISISRIERLNYSSQLLSTAPPLKLIAESEGREEQVEVHLFKAIPPSKDLTVPFYFSELHTLLICTHLFLPIQLS